MATKKTLTGNGRKSVEAIQHDEATRKNIPTAEYESVMQKEQEDPIRAAYERRNRDLDPQLVWRGKDEQDWSDLVVPAPPVYIQEKVHPKVLIDDLLRGKDEPEEASQLELFARFNGVPKGADKTDFYQHDHAHERIGTAVSRPIAALTAEGCPILGRIWRAQGRPVDAVQGQATPGITVSTLRGPTIGRYGEQIGQGVLAKPSPCLREAALCDRLTVGRWQRQVEHLGDAIDGLSS